MRLSGGPVTTGGASKKFMGGIGLNPIQVANCMNAVEHLALIGLTITVLVSHNLITINIFINCVTVSFLTGFVACMRSLARLRTGCRRLRWPC